MLFQVIQMVDGRLVRTDPTDIYAWAAAAGVEVTGEHRNPRTRVELQGWPTLRGFNGPMWGGERDGGPAVRWEDVASYERLSA